MKSIVIYFSHRGENYAVGNLQEGNAEHIAKAIASKTESPLFEIERAKPYPADYRACTKEAAAELQAMEFPEIVSFGENIEQYDLIYLCYPCWWGTFPRPVATFLSHYDWAKKTIKPMSTHEGSGMGESEADLRRLCPKAILKPGLAIKGTEARDSDWKIERWIAD